MFDAWSINDIGFLIMRLRLAFWFLVVFVIGILAGHYL